MEPKQERGGWLSRFGRMILGGLQTKPVYLGTVRRSDESYRKAKRVRKIARASRKANRVRHGA